MGRPSIMTPEIINKLEQAFMLGCSDLEACLFADIGKSTLYNYQDANPDFLERKEKLKENPILVARTSVISGLNNDPDLALRFLERRKKDEFSTKTEAETKTEIVHKLDDTDREIINRYIERKHEQPKRITDQDQQAAEGNSPEHGIAKQKQ